MGKVGALGGLTTTLRQFIGTVFLYFDSGVCGFGMLQM